ncbi:hypothetical protein BHM03_00023272 [Ensete ventricosum]|nr:hypothetical protein BHM03_00023272 [Ensete ventricosum]
MIEPIKEYEEWDLEPEDENTKEDQQSADCTTHTLAGHANPQALEVEESLKQQPVTILIKTRSTNNFMNSKVATQLMLQNESYSSAAQPLLQAIVAFAHSAASVIGRGGDRLIAHGHLPHRWTARRRSPLRASIASIGSLPADAVPVGDHP